MELLASLASTGGAGDGFRARRSSGVGIRRQRTAASRSTDKSLIINARGVVARREPGCESWEAFEVLMERN